MVHICRLPIKSTLRNGVTSSASTNPEEGVVCGVLLPSLGLGPTLLFVKFIFEMGLGAKAGAGAGASSSFSGVCEDSKGMMFRRCS